MIKRKGRGYYFFKKLFPVEERTPGSGKIALKESQKYSTGKPYMFGNLAAHMLHLMPPCRANYNATLS